MNVKVKSRLGWLKVLGLSGIALLVLAALWLWYLVVNPWPQTSGRLEVAGLLSEVKVSRDSWGIPHIYAQNDHDLFFAQAYVTAQDRLFQMELNRRVGNGTLSEVVGPLGLGTDKMARFYGLRRIAEKSFPLLDRHSQEAVQAYCDGINAFIASHPDRLPLEFALLNFKPKSWTVIDVMSFSNFMALLNGLNGSYELLRAQLVAKLGESMAADALPPYDPQNPEIVPKELESVSWASVVAPRTAMSEGLGESDMTDRALVWQNFLSGRNEWLGKATMPESTGEDDFMPGARDFGWASGAWAVSGRHTASGKPILVNDVHMSLLTPTFWYEIGLHGGQYDVSGFSLPGAPFVLLGRNKDIAWGFVNLNADVQDLYVETLDDPQKPTRYLFEGRWYDLEKRQEEIAVKGAKPYLMDLISTRHGPLANEYFAITPEELSLASQRDAFAGVWAPLQRDKFEGAQPISLRWAVADGCVVIRSVSELNRARNWEEFRAALSHWDALGESFVYADNQGNIGYQAAVKAPIRQSRHLGILPVSGSDGQYEWEGYIPFEHLPFLFNPPSGFVATANSKVVTDDYPYLLTYDWFHPGYRARSLVDHLKSLIDQGRAITVEDMRQLQGDTFSPSAHQLNAYLGALRGETPEEERILEYVRKWDGRYDLASVGASIHASWYSFLDVNTFEDELYEKTIWGANFPLKHISSLVKIMPDNENPWFDDAATRDRRETRDDIVRKSFQSAVRFLTANYGADPSRWTFERVQTVRIKHPIFGSVPVLGDLYNSSAELPFSGSPTSIAFAYSNRYPPQKYNVMFAATQRHIVSFEQNDRMLSVLSTGQSAHLFHPHREDQTRLWAEMEFHPMPSTAQGVEKASREVLDLVPKQRP